MPVRVRQETSDLYCISKSFYHTDIVNNKVHNLLLSVELSVHSQECIIKVITVFKRDRHSSLS
jgi:hypothetical protein